MRFPWQQQHHARMRIQEANTRPELKVPVVKVWAEFQMTISDRANTNGENDFRHMSRLRDRTVAIICTSAYYLH